MTLRAWHRTSEEDEARDQAMAANRAIMTSDRRLYDAQVNLQYATPSERAAREQELRQAWESNARLRGIQPGDYIPSPGAPGFYGWSKRPGFLNGIQTMKPRSARP